jgi:predicted nucleic acid-binding protein
MKEVVLDNSVLSAFAKIGRLGLLKQILKGQKVWIADTVYREIVHKEVRDAVYRPNKKNCWINAVTVDVSVFRAPEIDAGEAGTVRLAIEKNCVAVIDDLDGRRFAAKNGVKVIGTLALLKNAYERRLISKKETANILKDLQTKDAFRMTGELKDWVLDKKA